MANMSVSAMPEMKATVDEYVQLYESDPTMQNLMNITTTLFDAAARLWHIGEMPKNGVPDSVFIDLAEKAIAETARTVPVPNTQIPSPPLTEIGVTHIPEKIFSTFNTYFDLLRQNPNSQTAFNIVYTLLQATARVWYKARQLEHYTPLNENFVEYAGAIMSHLRGAVATGASVIPPKPPIGN